MKNGSKTKYSVLMSIYKEENSTYLKQSIESMLHQTYFPDEIVIVKDGILTDELEKTLNTYIDNFPKLFRTIQLKENVGLGRALDIGLLECRNELVARMDSDDISLPERCELQIEKFIEIENLSIVGTMIDEFYNEPTNIISSRIVPTTNKEIVKFMKRRSPFNHPTVMFKKSDVIRCGGYGKMRRKQDLDLFSRMINNGCEAINLNKSLLLFRSNEANFKRRKSWVYCMSYIEVQYAIWRRGHCGFIDFMYVLTGQIIMLVAPMFIIKKISNKYLRKSPEYNN